MQIQGKIAGLTPISPNDKDEFFELATKSYGSQFWYDETQTERNSKKAFFEDWTDDYFNIRKPNAGQCFWIVIGEKRIGAINYNEIDTHNKNTDIDIIIGAKGDLGKGFGSDAVKTLCNYLFQKHGLNKISIEPRANNERAIRAYQKAGFKKEGLLREEDFFHGKYVDCVRLGLLKKDFKWTSQLTAPQYLSTQAC